MLFDELVQLLGDRVELTAELVYLGLRSYAEDAENLRARSIRPILDIFASLLRSLEDLGLPQSRLCVIAPLPNLVGELLASLVKALTQVLELVIYYAVFIRNLNMN